MDVITGRKSEKNVVYIFLYNVRGLFKRWVEKNINAQNLMDGYF
jgi:hypothetical protein